MSPQVYNAIALLFQVTEDAVQNNSPLTYYYSGGTKTDESAMATEEANAGGSRAVAAE